MLTTTTSATRQPGLRPAARASRAARPVVAAPVAGPVVAGPRVSPVVVNLATVHVLDGGAHGAAFTGEARHALEKHGGLTSTERLDLLLPCALPRVYTPAQARRLADALAAAGAVVAITDVDA